MAIKVTKFKVDGNELMLPSYADGVASLDTAITSMIGAYDQNTVDAKINNLSSVYLGLTAKAADASKADSCTTAYKAERDGSGNVITSTYYKKTDTVEKAEKDASGNNIASTYAQKNGAYSQLVSGGATLAAYSRLATLDAKEQDIADTYIKSIQYEDSRDANELLITKGDGDTIRVKTKDTTYNAATSTSAGLMTAANFQKLSALSTNTSGQSVAYAQKAGWLASDCTVTITGGASGGSKFQSSGTTTITLGNINATSITSGTLAVGRGGTGQTNLDNVTVGKAKAFDSSRTVSIGGAVSGSETWSGSGNLSITTSNLDMAAANKGILDTLRGGTGNSEGKCLALYNNVHINGIQTNLANGTNIIHYGVCSSAAGTKYKTVSIPNFTKKVGAIIAVRFDYQNTAENPLLNVNDTGALYISPADSVNGFFSGTNLAFTHGRYNIVFFTLNSNERWQIIGAFADHAKKLHTARTIALSGGATGTPTDFDGSANVTIPVTGLNASNVNAGTLGTAYGGTGNSNGTIAKLTTARNVNGVPFDGSAALNFFAVCDTDASATTKVFTIANPGDGVNSIPDVFAVCFTKGNSAGVIAFNINGFGSPCVTRCGVIPGSVLTLIDGGLLANPICALPGSIAWFRAVRSGTAITSYQLIDAPAISRIKLTGDVSGDVVYDSDSASDGAFLINTTLTTSAYESRNLDPAEYEYDLNKVTDAGFYRLHMLGNWKNRPAGSSTGTHYMNVFRNSGNSKTLQQLFYHKGSRVWVRSFTSSETLPWYKFETSAVDTITTVSGGTSGDD